MNDEEISNMAEKALEDYIQKQIDTEV